MVRLDFFFLEGGGVRLNWLFGFLDQSELVFATYLLMGDVAVHAA